MTRSLSTFVSRGALAAALTAAFAGAAAAETYKVGLLLPFSGVYASLGEEIENGFRLGLDVNADKLGPHAVELVRENSEAKPAVGLAKARKLVLQERVDVVAGVVSSAVLGGLRDFLHGAKTPIVVANAGNDLMTGERCSPYLVRVSFSNSQIVRPMGPWMAAKGVESAYLLAPDYAAGRQMMGTFKESFEAAGGTVVGEGYPPLRGVKDYGPYLAAAQASGADAIFSFFAGGAAVAFVKQHAAFGLQESLPLYGAGWLVSPLYVAAQGAAANGVIGSLNYIPTIDTEANAAFQTAYQAKHDGRVASEYAVAGFDAARLIVEAIAAAGDDKAAFDAALRSAEFDGPRGPLRIDPDTNNVVQTIYVFETTVGADGAVRQTVLDTVPDQRDPVAGCVMD